MADRVRHSESSSGWSANDEKVTESKSGSPSKRLRLVTAKKLVRIEHAPRVRYWGKVIEDGMLGMVYGRRGSGKTFFVLGVAISMASRARFLGKRPGRPLKVVILDGEMGSRALKARILEIQASLGAKSISRLEILTPDLSTAMLPSLANREGQRLIDELIPKDTDVIIVDNVSSWNHDGREDADGWSAWSEWLLRHKHLGRTVIIVHHAGKSGAQRGTSRREDLLDFVIALQPGANPKHKDALAFHLVWEKSRGLGKKDVPPLLVTRVEKPNAVPRWEYEIVVSADALRERAVALRKEGKTLAEIGKTLGRDKSTVSRLLKEVSEE